MVAAGSKIVRLLRCRVTFPTFLFIFWCLLCSFAVCSYFAVETASPTGLIRLVLFYCNFHPILARSPNHPTSFNNQRAWRSFYHPSTCEENGKRKDQTSEIQVLPKHKETNCCKLLLSNHPTTYFMVESSALN